MASHHQNLEVGYHVADNLQIDVVDCYIAAAIAATALVAAYIEAAAVVAVAVVVYH